MDDDAFSRVREMLARSDPAVAQCDLCGLCPGGYEPFCALHRYRRPEETMPLLGTAAKMLTNTTECPGIGVDCFLAFSLKFQQPHSLYCTRPLTLTGSMRLRQLVTASGVSGHYGRLADAEFPEHIIAFSAVVH